MTHDEAIGWIPGWVDGRLEEPDSSRVADHAGGCEECRSLAEGYRLIARVLRAESASAGGEHPSSDALVGYATGLVRIDPAEHLRIARHVAACPDCASDVDATRAAEREVASRAADPAEPPRASRRAGWRLAVAASFVLGAIAAGYPVYLLASRSGRGVSVTGPGAAWSGVTALPVISGTLRGDARPATIVEAPGGRPTVAFALSIPAEIAVPSSSALDLTILGASGREIWRTRIEPGGLPALAGSAGAVLVVVPSDRMAPDDYVVRVTRHDDPGAMPLLEAAFRVVR